MIRTKDYLRTWKYHDVFIILVSYYWAYFAWMVTSWLVRKHKIIRTDGNIQHPVCKKKWYIVALFFFWHPWRHYSHQHPSEKYVQKYKAWCVTIPSALRSCPYEEHRQSGYGVRAPYVSPCACSRDYITALIDIVNKLYFCLRDGWICLLSLWGPVRS